jgi:stigma-specific protein Stig1
MCGQRHGCVDVNSDPKNCGMCGHACGRGQTCSNGVCRAKVEVPQRQPSGEVPRLEDDLD